ncbi:MAG: S-adenosylmethionine decarboxylase [Colwelliaceae bacterium]|nr:S-adenosylmethionine decarboxylase [Colwelliaceae bacterium]
MQKLKLHGFNNLTKSLSISLYNTRYVESNDEQINYSALINKKYNAINLNEKLTEYALAVGGTVLNTAIQDYKPQGASVNLMIAEGGLENESSSLSIINHLDKSHICAHTYPEENFYQNIALFRIDIEISTCGVISPLVLLQNIFSDFNPHLAFIDYRIRGVNINSSRKKQFLDHSIKSLQEFISQQTLIAYQVEDINIENSHIFHSKFIKTQDIENEIFNQLTQTLLNTDKKQQLLNKINADLLDIYHNQ